MKTIETTKDQREQTARTSLFLSFETRRANRQSHTHRFNSGKLLTGTLHSQRPLLFTLLLLLFISHLCASATPAPAHPGDMVINEVMASPKGARGLPETDYVELYNTTDHTISLKGWSFIYDGTVIRLPDVPLAANHYAVLYRKGKSLPLNKKALGLGFSNFPLNMSDEGKQLTLKDSSGTVIHSYTYPKAKAGRSIERGEGDKWHLSTDPRGGTPGEENSVGPSVPTPKPDDLATPPDTPSEPPLVPSDTVKFGDIVINEVMASPKGAKGLPETDYVELYNTTSHTISLKGWSFIYDGTVIRLPDVPLAANRYAVLYRKGKSLPLDKKALGLGFSNFPLNMSDEGKRLTLKDSSGTVIHSYTYPKAKAGRSIERGEGDKWHLSTDPRGGTPGEENSEGAPDKPDKPEKPKASPGDVLINEVMADPRGLTKLPATEYVELHNTTDHEINLEGWAFVYDKTSIPLPDAELSAGGYAVLYKAGREISVADGAAEVAVKRFPANMVNAGKPLTLKDPSGTVIHSYTYPKAKAGRSIERGEGDKWHLSSDPRGGTPGEENSEGEPDKPDKPEKPKASPGDVLINEVMADPGGLTKLSATEYVELHNTTDHEINLEGWAFVYDKTSIPLPDAELPAGGYAVLYKVGREISVADGAAEVAVKRFPANMVNAGKPLALKDPSGTVIHSYTYPKAKAGRSIERGEGDKWHLSSDPRGGTPGEENSEGAPDKPDEPKVFSPGDVLINEVMADPHGLTKLPTTEYVELHNTTDHEIDLEGWAFVYDKTSIPLPDAELPAGGYAVLYKAGREISVAEGAAEVAVKRFPANMINAGKPLALKDPSGTVIHSYTYPKAKAGRSIERGEGDKWHLSTDPRGGTPGEENSEGAPDKPDKPEKPKASPGDVLINEVMADPHGLTKLPATEYVELHNTTDHEIDLEGWTFVYDKTAIPLPDAELPAGGYAVLYKAGREISVADGAAEVALKRFPANMINAGKPLALKDPSGTVIHSYAYPKAKAGRSIERGEGDKWHLSTDPRGGTPGEENSEGAPDKPDKPEKPKASPGDVLINEVMADPYGLTKLPATEYVELHNTTDHEINLEGWTFVYDKTSIPLPETELSAGGYAVLYKAGREISVADGAAEVAVKRFPANMVNAGKPLALKDPSGTVIHSYAYPKAKAGRSIERGEGDKWHLSSDPRGGTPGEENSEGTPDRPDESEKPKASPGDVLINEVMADSRGLTKLPATEYVELRNTTDHEINLEGWTFVYDKTSIPLPDAELPAGGYAVLYKAGREISVAEGAVEVAVKRFPANMVNAGKPLALKDPSGTVIHSYAYPKAKAGRSIERGEGDKWHLSSDPRGGTPGEENSEDMPDKPDKPEKEKSSPGDVLINEVMADPRGLTKLPATEYVELHNTTDHEINLEGWAFVYDKTSIPLPDAELPAGGYAVLYKAGREISVADGAAEVAVKRFPANMINAGKPLALKDPSGTVIHSYTYPKAKAGRSIERGEGDKWHLSSDPRGGTPGEENSEGAPDKPEKEKSSPGDVLINEVMADPHGLTKFPATEYVELHNTTDHEIDLEGWTFVYDKTSIPLPDTELSAGGYAVLYKAGREISVADGAAEVAVKRFPANMINAGKPLALKDPSGTVIHSYTYPKAKAGRSIERGEGDTWHLSSDPRGGTPGEENSEGAPDKPDEPNKPNEPDATEQVEPREIILNEILFDPQPRGSEYIELYNRSDRTLSTHGLAIALRKSDGHLGTRHSLTSLATTLAPGDYLVLTSDPNGVTSLIRTPALDVIRRFKLPALNNQGATIVLLRTADSTVVDEVTYSAKWHSSAVKIRRGVALERISPDGSSQEAANWTSASSETGYGTPGYKNSQSGTSSQIEEGATISEPEYNASTRDYLIRYRMDKPDYRCQMAVYSSNGQKVAVIANNQLLTPEGEIRWDGAGLTPGVYVFYVELYHPDGSSQHIRKPLLVH